MLPSIVVIGSSNTDLVIETSQFPAVGETVMGKNFFTNFGGKGANQAVAAARLGADVSFVCRVGDDANGKNAIKHYKKEQLNTDYVFTDKFRPTGTAFISINEHGENQIIVVAGANAGLSKQDIDAALPVIQEADIVLLQLESPIETVEYAIQKSIELGKKIMLNPAPAQKIPDEVYKNLFLITPNLAEVEFLTGIQVKDMNTAKYAAIDLLCRGVQNVIITLGESGAYLQTAQQQAHIPAPKVNVIDSTGAGDVFNGALAVALAEGLDILKASHIACKAAAISVTRRGTQNTAPFRKELMKGL